MKSNNPSKGVWKAVCGVCGFTFNSNELKLRWDNLYVCDKDYEPRNILDFFKAREGSISVPWVQREDVSLDNYASITDTDSPYTATVSIEQIDVDATDGNVVINMPVASTYVFADSKQLKIRRTDASANTLTVQRQGSDTINGATSELLGIHSSTVYSNDAVTRWRSL